MMDDKCVYLLDFKKATWADFSELLVGESEDAARDYIEIWHPDMMPWYRRFGNLYARRRMEDGTIFTYRIRARTLVTAEEVAEIRARKEARRMKLAAQNQVVEGIVE